jgi:hypothetical protein
MLPCYSIAVLLTEPELLDFVEFEIPTHFTSTGKPLAWKKVKYDAALTKVERIKGGYKHCMRIFSMDVPPIQPGGN